MPIFPNKTEKSSLIFIFLIVKERGTHGVLIIRGRWDAVILITVANTNDLNTPVNGQITRLAKNGSYVLP